MGFYRFQAAFLCWVLQPNLRLLRLLGEHLGWQESAGIAVIVAAGILSSLKARN
jgi:hypothetical protein